MKLRRNYSLTNHMYIHLNACKQITDVKLFSLPSRFLRRRIKKNLNKCPEYATKQCDDEAPVMQALRRMHSILHCHRPKVHSGWEWYYRYRVLSMGQTELRTYANCPVGWGCKIHRLHLCRGVRPSPQRVSWI